MWYLFYHHGSIENVFFSELHGLYHNLSCTLLIISKHIYIIGYTVQQVTSCILVNHHYFLSASGGHNLARNSLTIKSYTGVWSTTNLCVVSKEGAESFGALNKHE